MKMPLLELKEVELFYGNVQALWGVSLEVREGEIVAIVGANGAGKSTTLNAISGLVHAVRGKIIFQGKSIEKTPPHQIVEAGISLAPEGRQLWPGLDVLENLELGAFLPRARKDIEAHLEWIFSFFPPLRERKGQKAGTLSGGEQQMLAIGRALMTRPKLLMLDEASLGLAPVIVEELFQVIRKINKEGVSILLIEQDAFLALETAQRAYVLETGKVSLQGDTRDLLENPYIKNTYLGL
jgi:branched-chain amino acid transport system ATP-binding protein